MVRQRTPLRTEAQVDASARVYSDDECVRKLAALLEYRDNRNLADIARLIGRLAVPVE